MAGVSFYATKMACIVVITLVYFVVLAAGSYALSKVFPSDPRESIETTFLLFLGQIAAFVLIFYAARTELKKIPQIFDGINEFRSDMLKERDGEIVSGLALLMFSDSFLQRGVKIKEWVQKNYQ